MNYIACESYLKILLKINVQEIRKCLDIYVLLNLYTIANLSSKHLLKGQVWWYIPVIPATGTMRQNCEFKGSPDSRVSLKPAWAN
jgi:hypothetical protein